jgi:putative PIN family toxin of toxin-antitoxin system
MSEELMTELRRVIVERFPRARPQLEIYEKLLRRYAIWVPLGNDTIAISRDPDDDKFIETAMTGSCQYIVSGDKDLLDLKAYDGVKIVNATKFLQVVQ